MPTREELYDEADRLKEAGKLEEAVAKLQEVVALDPTYTLAHAGLAKHLTTLKRHDEAIAHALKVAELEPNEPFSYTALSVIYQRAGKIREAEDAKAKANGMHGGW